MSELRDCAKSWIDQNVMDGECRLSSGKADSHHMSSPDVYELVDDLLEMYEESAPQSQWVRVDSAKDIPIGTWQVATESRKGRDIEIHIAEVSQNVIIVGSHFHFDMPSVYAYAPCLDLPTPPNGG